MKHRDTMRFGHRPSWKARLVSYFRTGMFCLLYLGFLILPLLLCGCRNFTRLMLYGDGGD